MAPAGDVRRVCEWTVILVIALVLCHCVLVWQPRQATERPRRRRRHDQGDVEGLAPPSPREVRWGPMLAGHYRPGGGTWEAPGRTEAPPKDTDPWTNRMVLWQTAPTEPAHTAASCVPYLRGSEAFGFQAASAADGGRAVCLYSPGGRVADLLPAVQAVWPFLPGPSPDPAAVHVHVLAPQTP